MKMLFPTYILFGLSALLSSVFSAAIPENYFLPRRMRVGDAQRVDGRGSCPNVHIGMGWYGAHLGPQWWNNRTSCGACAQISSIGGETEEVMISTISVKVRPFQALHQPLATAHLEPSCSCPWSVADTLIRSLANAETAAVLTGAFRPVPSIPGLARPMTTSGLGGRG